MPVEWQTPALQPIDWSATPRSITKSGQRKSSKRLRLPDRPRSYWSRALKSAPKVSHHQDERRSHQPRPRSGNTGLAPRDMMLFVLIREGQDEHPQRQKTPTLWVTTCKSTEATAALARQSPQPKAQKRDRNGPPMSQTTRCHVQAIEDTASPRPGGRRNQPTNFAAKHLYFAHDKRS